MLNRIVRHLEDYGGIYQIGVQIVLIGGLFYYIVQKDCARENLTERNIGIYNQVCYRADENKDGLVSVEEWGNVHNKIGKAYDPRTLSTLKIEDMEQYLKLTESNTTKRRSSSENPS